MKDTSIRPPALLILIILFFTQCNNKKVKVGENTNNEIPERIICVGQHTTELLIKLGLQKKIIGWCFPDSEKQPKVPMISKLYPSKEAILSMSPDFIFSGFAGTFKKENLGDRESLKKLGIDSYVSYYRTLEGVRPITYLDFFMDIQEIGRIFNIVEESQKLEDSLKKEFLQTSRQVKPKSQKTKVLVLSGIFPNGEILVTGGYDLSTNLLEMAEGNNIFDYMEKQEFVASIEDILKLNPEFIVLKESINDPGANFSKKILLENPSLKNLIAVREQKFIVVEFSSLFPSLKNIDAYKKIVLELNK